MASASLLTEAVAGRTGEEALGLSGEVEALVGAGLCRGSWGCWRRSGERGSFPGGGRV